jgi:hypothetical protein
MKADELLILSYPEDRTDSRKSLINAMRPKSRCMICSFQHTVFGKNQFVNT